MKLITWDPPAIEAVCGKRPSTQIRSPYVADIYIGDTMYFAHAPALHLGGLMSVGSKILVVPIKSEKCKYRIEAVWHSEDNVWVGSNPVLGNTLYRKAVEHKYECIKAEFKYENCRFDFLVNNDTLVEVKAVPICDANKVGIFPVGPSTKKKQGIISDRAIKQLQCLQGILQRKEYNACLVYIIMRGDIHAVRANIETDPTYAHELAEAVRLGLKVHWLTMDYAPNGISLVSR